MVIPLDLRIERNDNPAPIILKINQTYPLEILVTRHNNTAPPSVSLNGIELSLIGMTDSGLQGLTYIAKPQRFNMTEKPSVNGTIDLTIDAKEAIAR